MSNTPGMVVSAVNPARSPNGNAAVVIPEGEGAGNKIPANKSSQKLVSEDFLQTSSTSNSIGSSGGGGDNLSSSDDNSPQMGRNRTKVSKMEWVTVFILFYVNLINYMDRFTLAGKLMLESINEFHTFYNT